MASVRKTLPLAGNIRYLRSQLGISQAALGANVGLSRSNIASYETAKAEPRAAKLAELAAFFRVSLEELITLELSAQPETSAPAPAPAPAPSPANGHPHAAARGPGVGPLRSLQQRNARIRGALTRLEYLAGSVSDPEMKVDLNLIAINFERMVKVVHDLVRNDEEIAAALARDAV